MSKLKVFWDKPAVKICVSGMVLFIAAIAFAPAAGLLRTIPFFILAGCAAELFGVSFSMCISMSFAMTLCVYLVSGRGTGESLLFAAVSILLSASGMYIVRLWEVVRKTDKKNVKRKGAAYILVSLIVSLVLSFVLCGNAVSFVLCDSDNTTYINEHYAQSVEKKYTCYEAFSGGYFTYVSFKDGNDVYGNDDGFCINAKEIPVYDDVRNYREEKMLTSACAALSEIVSGKAYGFNVVSADIPFADGEVLGESDNVSEYLERVNYVISFDSIIENGEKDKFANISSETVLKIEESGFVFDNIVLCGGNASEVLYCVEMTGKTAPSEVYTLVKDYGEAVTEAYGISETDILDYWNNK